ncbi:hypothetical protein MC7420_6232 [Coleofasciculus chthonoplastes PCC 7420]|uniref:Uncharacterized protein n=1 Tax=Coleofasciculus chthonoplastes PCC 7420 TaxID=118168 RepID=B4VU03_9CYAN|nr:hypothetical protein MC7420_6232 [Coleofasciculus chthonoplastes PCC 7420]
MPSQIAKTPGSWGSWGSWGSHVETCHGASGSWGSGGSEEAGGEKIKLELER